MTLHGCRARAVYSGSLRSPCMIRTGARTESGRYLDGTCALRQSFRPPRTGTRTLSSSVPRGFLSCWTTGWRQTAGSGITGSLTRMEEGCLFLSGEHRLQSVAGGVKHYGLAMFTAGISSELFSSGLAGSGWAILRNGTSGIR